MVSRASQLVRDFHHVVDIKRDGSAKVRTEVEIANTDPFSEDFNVNSLRTRSSTVPSVRSSVWERRLVRRGSPARRPPGSRLGGVGRSRRLDEAGD